VTSDEYKKGGNGESASGRTSLGIVRKRKDKRQKIKNKKKKL